MRNPTDEAASAIIQGGLHRAREIYYPWLECVPTITLHFFFPDLMDQLLRAVSVK